ncbi:MAG: glycosyltransferase family 4 protein [Kiritimatiellia bacterium]
MKIVHIVPGSGDTFYCQNCMRDRDLIRALRALGHDVILAPMYLPMFLDGDDISSGAPVFYGAVGVYLAQKLPWLGSAPPWMRRLMDSRSFLGWIAKKAGTTRASGLEDMTLSVLKGESGGQSGELDRLVAWLKNEIKPDVVHLSNALLLGLAKRIRLELGVPVVCTLQDEDTWVNTMESGAAAEAWRIMAGRSDDVAAFVSVSRYYKGIIRARMQIADEKVHVIPIGINHAGCEETPLDENRPAIGYLSRMSEALGLGVLAEAFAAIKANGRIANLKLKIMGGYTPDDRPFLARLRHTLAQKGIAPDVEFCSSFDKASRLEFLRSLSVLSVPVRRPEAFGLFILEALASGVPVVQPAIGAAPELVEATGGGVCYEPNDAEALARELEGLLLDPARARRLGRAGRDVVLRDFTVQKMADRMQEVYQKCLGK